MQSSLASGEATQSNTQTIEYPPVESSDSTITALAEIQSAIATPTSLLKAPRSYPLWYPTKAKVRILWGQWKRIETTQSVTLADGSTVTTTTVRYQLTILIDSNHKGKTSPGDPTLSKRYKPPPKGAELGTGHWVRRKLSPKIKTWYIVYWVRLPGKYRVTTYWDGTRWPGCAAISMHPAMRFLRWLFGKKIRIPRFGTLKVNDWGSAKFGADIYSQKDFCGYLPIWVYRPTLHCRSVWAWVEDK